jgi:hypothetical protein
MGLPSIGPSGDVLWSPVNMQNANLMMTTQSIQDAPLGSDPADPVDSVDPPPAAAPPTKKKVKK